MNLRVTITSVVVGLVLAVAAWSKATDGASLKPALSAMGLPDQVLPHAVALIAGFEAALAGWLFLRPMSPAARRVAFVTILAFSGVLAFLLTSTHPPACGCFAGLIRFESAKTELVFGIGRNMALLGLLLIPAGPSVRHWASPSRPPGCTGAEGRALCSADAPAAG